MKMKNYVLSVCGWVVVFVFTSCESHERKVDDAFERVKEAKRDFIDTAAICVNENKPGKTRVIIKNEITDAWALFRSETENKIKLSENKIKELKERRNNSENKAKFDKQINRLEQKNNDLRKKMNDYNEEVKSKWENFKVEMNHDIDEIEIELKDVTINNTNIKK
ncbi:MAG: hypothetical protein Q8M15_00585 [Bacteroidota bacterium]|nr:hypothetical protein [Bacteroidota bacterium]